MLCNTARTQRRALYMVYTAKVTFIPICEETEYSGDSVCTVSIDEETICS